MKHLRPYKKALKIALAEALKTERMVVAGHLWTALLAVEKIHASHSFAQPNQHGFATAPPRLDRKRLRLSDK